MCLSKPWIQGIFSFAPVIAGSVKLKPWPDFIRPYVRECIECLLIYHQISLNKEYLLCLFNCTCLNRTSLIDDTMQLLSNVNIYYSTSNVILHTWVLSRTVSSEILVLTSGPGFNWIPSITLLMEFSSCAKTAPHYQFHWASSRGKMTLSIIWMVLPYFLTNSIFKCKGLGFVGFKLNSLFKLHVIYN